MFSYMYPFEIYLLVLFIICVQVIQGFRLSSLSAPVLDDSTVSQLCEMGFPLEACRKAVYYTGNTGIDAAMNWIMSHMEDSGVCGGKQEVTRQHSS